MRRRRHLPLPFGRGQGNRRDWQGPPCGRHAGHRSFRQDEALFAYDAAYLESSRATPLSQSLPLRVGPFSTREFRPYFERLLAEGSARRALASELQLPEDD
ncbi:HipA N-terminal domain-containing protein [Gordonibacter sp. An230]|uniref:HipA N-terminal domain-containing protein n=1 Tax=Gordonibacter sp. An230 TaxID=1965592 RepID=UPI0013A67F15